MHKLLVPVAAVALCSVYLLVAALRTPPTVNGFDLEAFGRLPVQYGGRIKPIDSVARTALLTIYNRQSFHADGHDATALQWLLTLATDPAEANTWKVFRVDLREIVDIIGAENEGQHYFSYNDIAAKWETLADQFDQAGEVDESQRSLYQKKVLELQGKVYIYLGLSQFSRMLVPPGDGGDWVDLYGAWSDPADTRGVGEDAAARLALTWFNGRPTVKVGEKELTPGQWLARLRSAPETARDDAVFLASDADAAMLLEQIGMMSRARATGAAAQPGQRRYSYNELTRLMQSVAPQMRDARQVFASGRTSPSIRRALNLADYVEERLGLFNRLIGVTGRPTSQPAAMPGPAADAPAAAAILRAVSAWSSGDATEFNVQVQALAKLADAANATAVEKSAFEAWFNRFDPWIKCMFFYIAVLLLACISWLGLGGVLRPTAFWLLALTMVVHTLGLAARIYMQGRPPVTNLYSSAIFIGWGVTVLALILEVLFRNAIGSVAAAFTGFCTLLIAQNLSVDGDTMATLQAVLATNFWLATHVVCVTLGYATTYLAALLAVIYILGGVFTTAIRGKLAADLSRMIYGTICFALFFSFIGTVLGGIWADQSWGRFWGWDPKENGALIIVIWNALILHARWDGMVRRRGLAVLTVFGIVVTTWSWFGVNQLGVGLHSYGFRAGAMTWILAVVALSVLIMITGMLPKKYWLSHAIEQTAADGGPTPPLPPQQSSQAGG
ncbi:MAG: Cytochrome c biogenesis protein CcsA [Phycisphaerae bacterium]|nr:Cytochrome c biogenesis protein CcsA [Phycisphaerae bacterium]